MFCSYTRDWSKSNKGVGFVSTRTELGSSMGRTMERVEVGGTG